ncbi:YceI family protein [Streptacidiphilus sp. PAMC 29251]
MAATLSPDLSGTYTIDPAHSRIGFVARHAMVTKVRGSFNEFTGAVVVDAEKPEQSSVNLVIKVDSIDTRNADRDGHLRSNDFLDLATYPEIVFASTGVELTDDTSLKVTGNLTVRGVTQAITIDFDYEGAATDPFGNHRLGFEGTHAISRKDYGIVWNAPLETGGVLVSDKITLEFEVSLVKNA